MPMPIEWTSGGSSSRRTDSNTISPAPTRISIPSIAAARFSTLSCPHGWLSSAGSSALRTETKATIDAIRSMLECAASVMIAIDPVTAPAATFSTIRTLFEMIETAAARCLGRCAYGPMAPTGSIIPAPRRPARAAAAAPRARGG